MDAQASAPKHTYSGSCHCRAITYTVALSIGANPSTTRCNCTFCLKSGFTPYPIAVESDFTLLTPSSSIADLTSYQFTPTSEVKRFFCPKCGIQVLGKGKYELEGHQIDFFTVNLVTLDQREGEELDLSKFKIEYWDGRNDNWMAGRKDGPWPNGIF